MTVAACYIYFCFISICLYLCLAFVGLHEFDTQKNHEVNEFRMKMRSFCEEKAQERQLLPWHQWMEYNFPCDLEPVSVAAQSGRLHTSIKKIFINVKFEASEVSRCGFWVQAHLLGLTSSASLHNLQCVYLLDYETFFKLAVCGSCLPLCTFAANFRRCLLNT